MEKSTKKARAASTDTSIDVPAAAPYPVERRSQARRSVLLAGSVHNERGDIDCLIYNVSCGGAKVRVLGKIDEQSPVTLRVTGLGDLFGDIAWKGAKIVGIKFREKPEIVSQVFGLPMQELAA